MNKSFVDGTFPDCLKIAHVTPIHKAGDITVVSNYRPISVLPIMYKIFEKCIAERISNYLSVFNILSSHQHGFRRGLGTVDALIRLSESIYNGLNCGMHTAGVFIDLKKAFDTVNHQVLLDKLEHYGFRGPAFRLINSYLSNRQQVVRMGSSVSSREFISIGVPQGSILGPLLFLLYINYFPNALSSSSSVLLADDTTVLLSSVSYERLINHLNLDLAAAFEWTKVNRLSVNVVKTVAMLFTNRSGDVNLDNCIVFKEQEVEFSMSTKFLGVIVDNHLKYDEHIALVNDKLSKAIGIMYRIRQQSSDRTMLLLYYSLIYPYMIYCNLVWGSTFASHLDSMFILQKKAIRIVTGADYLAHTEPLFAKTGVLKLRDLHKYLLCVHMFTRIDETGQPQHSYHTRRRNDVRPAYQRLTRTQQSLTYAAPSVWNPLPRSLREMLRRSLLSADCMFWGFDVNKPRCVQTSIRPIR